MLPYNNSYYILPFQKRGGGLDAVEGGILLASVGDGRLKGRGGGRGER